MPRGSSDYLLDNSSVSTTGVQIASYHGNTWTDNAWLLGEISDGRSTKHEYQGQGQQLMQIEIALSSGDIYACIWALCPHKEASNGPRPNRPQPEV
jgi:hypothetical protein